MRFDELLKRVQQRAVSYQQTRSLDQISTNSAIGDARELERAAQPVVVYNPTGEEGERLASAYLALGWLYYFRSTLPSGPAQADLARAIAFFLMFDATEDYYPAGLRGVVGPTASPDNQATTAAALLNSVADVVGETRRGSNAYLVTETGADEALLGVGITLLDAAIAGTSQSDPNRPSMVSNLILAHRTRFERMGVSSDLDRAIELGELEIAGLDGSSEGGELVSDLGVSYLIRYETAGSLPDAERAIELGELAVASSPGDGAPAGILSNLSNAYQARYRRRGHISDLERAIEVGEAAVAQGSSDDQMWPGWLSNLGNAYRLRYNRDGALVDLSRTIELGELAVSATSNTDINRAKYLSNLSNAYSQRHDRQGTHSDLQRMIELGEFAVSAAPDTDTNKAKYLSNLSAAYQVRYRRLGAFKDIEQSIALGERALELTGMSHPERAGRLSNLGNAYLLRSASLESLSDVHRAVKAAELALAATPASHPEAAARLLNLASAYFARFEMTGERLEVSVVAGLSESASKATNSTPSQIASMRHMIGVLAHLAGALSTAIEMLDTAVQVLPSMTPREFGWADQEYRIGQQLGLAAEAIAAHLALNDPTGAIEISELGRGILLAAELDSQTDLTDLQQAMPELADQFRKVRAHLNASSEVFATQTKDATETANRRTLQWRHYDELLSQIRKHEDFSRFLLVPRLSELQSAAIGGAVVLVNASRCRCDAIVVTPDGGPTQIELADLHLSDVRAWARALLDATNSEGRLVGALRKQRLLPEILGWLWDAIVSKVLYALPPVHPTSESSPRRVWWLPIGLLGLFPLHAAGNPGQAGALDHLVSSYIPTLRTFAHTRRAKPRAMRRQLTVALRHTPGLPDLPGTVDEARELRTAFSDTLALTEEQATTAHVLDALASTTWAHFACHAEYDPIVPSRSGLRLHNGLLQIPEVSRLRLEQAELAYLSACSTAHRGWQHSDESLHLASAFHLAGFRHVVASLWPLDDAIAATAARMFYRRLPAMSADQAALCLNTTSRGLRDEHPSRPDWWAALIHSGP
ncbi:MAG TPA: CHAT domain-containing tetratricopeptide repeat protein [Micromonosporaceae bacterium]|nr:CHAT domain-containing tetratricopeptide repeat protein [Micromonosporaceae bacterium]